jgi:hypothetical protein
MEKALAEPLGRAGYIVAAVALITAAILGAL